MEKSEIVNIGFLIHNMEGKGGTERVTVQIANGLNRSGYKVYIFSCREGNSSVYNTDEEVEFISLEGETVSNPVLRKVRTVKELANRIRQKKIDIMIAVDVMLYPYIYYLQKKHYCKGVAWEHFNYYGKETLGTQIRNHAARNADALVVLSERDKNNYEENCRKIRNIVHIYNPVSVSIPNVECTKEKMVLSVGRLEDQKGYDMLLKAWKDVEKRCPEWKLVIVGSGSKETELRQIIKNDIIKNVAIEPFTNDIWSYYRRAQLYVMSSRYEGFPLVLIEAQASGLPIVSFDCKEGPSEVIRDGINGLLVPEGSIDTLSDRIVKVLDDDSLREEMSVHSRDDLSRYDEDSVMEEWNRLIQDLREKHDGKR